MPVKNISELLKNNPYNGRGIIVGKSEDGISAVLAYFIMGRSVNSRNRIFEKYNDCIRTKAFDESKLTDPHLIIYNAVRCFDNKIIVTNGDQTDTIYEYLNNDKCFECALFSREFEDDEPNYTPRISAVLNISPENFFYKINIIKADNNGKSKITNNFCYENTENGIGHFIHTYQGDGNPLPSFNGEPHKININGSIDDFSKNLWENLNNENKISLYVRFIELASGKKEEIIINKNK
ncbi:MAG: IMP cyclohydrolase [Candidatus Fimenecus sp.]